MDPFLLLPSLNPEDWQSSPRVLIESIPNPGYKIRLRMLGMGLASISSSLRSFTCPVGGCVSHPQDNLVFIPDANLISKPSEVWHSFVNTVLKFTALLKAGSKQICNPLSNTRSFSSPWAYELNVVIPFWKFLRG